MDNEKLMSMFFSNMKLRGLSENSIKGYRFDLKHFFEKVNKLYNEVQWQDINMYFLEMVDKKKAKSIAREMAAIKSFYKWLMHEDFVEKDPTLKLESPKLGKSLPKFLDDQEVEQYFSVIKSKRDFAVVKMLFYTGMRLNELFQLNIDDIKWESKTITVRGKGNKERVVFFTDQMAVILKEYLNSRTDSNQALFTSKNGSRLNKRVIQKFIARYGVIAGLHKKVTPHSWRHTLFTKLLRNKVPLKEISSIAGHSSTSVTEIYARLDLDTVKTSYDYVMNKKD